MAKTLASDQIMPSGKMKPILVLSKREPVQAAIALTSDSEAVMLLDKKAKPRAVMSMLKADAAKAGIVLNATTIRFGRAEVDPDYDPATVRLFVNKDTPGTMRPKLVELVKRASYQKVDINVDPSLEEAEGEHESQAPQDDHAALTAELAGLIPRIPDAAGNDPARLAALNKVAAAIGAHLQAGDAEGARTALAALRQAVETAPASAARDPAAGAGVRVAKGLLLWNGTRSYVSQQLAKLEDAIVAECSEEPDFDQIKANVGAINAVLDRLDDRLSEKLDQLRGTTDRQQKLAISNEAKQVVADYQRYIAEDELMADIDDNGFIPLNIKPRLVAVLDAVLQTL